MFAYKSKTVKTTSIAEALGVATTFISSERHAFNDYAGRYDAWYDSPKGRALFATEVACLRPLMEPLPKPHLEVGVGSGRFAKALRIEWGVDPSPRALEKARRREIKVVLGRGEDLPFGDALFGGVLLALTLCFVSDPNKVLKEVRRILVPGGGLVLGLLLKGTHWADLYARHGAEGHPFYRTAHFYSKEETEAMLKQNGFRITAYRSTLFQEPAQEVYAEEQSIDRYVAGAGFAGIAVVKMIE